MINFAVLGGLLLIVGAYLTMKGWIYRSVGIYLVADVCWVVLAYEKGDILGMSFIIVGTILGVIALYKMHKGIMHKNL